MVDIYVNLFLYLILNAWKVTSNRNYYPFKKSQGGKLFLFTSTISINHYFLSQNFCTKFGSDMTIGNLFSFFLSKTKGRMGYFMRVCL